MHIGYNFFFLVNHIGYNLISKSWCIKLRQPNQFLSKKKKKESQINAYGFGKKKKKSMLMGKILSISFVENISIE